jgi:hypothetical protein
MQHKHAAGQECSSRAAGHPAKLVRGRADLASNGLLRAKTPENDREPAFVISSDPAHETIRMRSNSFLHRNGNILKRTAGMVRDKDNALTGHR